ncbi:MAG: (d)CMP kinase [Candidatus Omnitrophica bacterium]|nr:(d)CMP kinase [Candidatus Omnitrophota bacterium]
MIIAVDGPAGSGKSTVCREVAKRLGLRYADTGAMYRTLALASIREKISPSDTNQLIELARRIPLEIHTLTSGRFEIFLAGEKVTETIREPAVNQIVSLIARIPEVRTEMVKRQRALAKSGYLIMEGRDISTVVLPDAEFKFYLDADPSVRAERRWKEDQAKGTVSPLSRVQEDQAKRDEMDRTRDVSPLRVASNAICIDTTGKRVGEVVHIILGKMNVKREKFNAFYAVTRRFLWLLAKAGFGLEIQGAENIPQHGGFIIAANHRSFLDPVVAAIASPRQLTFLARHTLFRNVLFGILIRGLNARPIKRASADRNALRLAAGLIMAGNGILLFPEGTRSADGGFLTPKGGLGYLAVKLGCPVVPMCIKGTFETFPRHAKWPRQGKISVRLGRAVHGDDFGKGIDDGDLYLLIVKEVMRNIEILFSSA